LEQPLNLLGIGSGDSLLKLVNEWCLGLRHAQTQYAQSQAASLAPLSLRARTMPAEATGQRMRVILRCWNIDQSYNQLAIHGAQGKRQSSTSQAATQSKPPSSRSRHARQKCAPMPHGMPDLSGSSRLRVRG